MLGVIASARSGQNRRKPQRLEVLQDMAKRSGALFSAPMSLASLDSTLLRWAEEGVSTVAVNGGDGTLHRVVTAAIPAFETPPKFAILPGGTMNIVARSTGWLGDPPEALGRVIAGSVVEQERSLLQVGDLYGFLWGNGLLARFLEVYEEGDTTAARAVSILARGAASAMFGGPFVRRLTRRHQGKVVIDGETLERTDFLAVAAGTVEQIGLGFRPFRMTGQVGQMHAVALGSSAARFAFELPRVYFGRPLAAASNLERPARKIELMSDQPIGFMLDGDFHQGGHELVVNLGPTVRFLVPSRATRRSSNRS